MFYHPDLGVQTKLRSPDYYW